MKQFLILIIPLFLLSCGQLCEDQNNKITLLESQLEQSADSLNTYKGDLEVCKTGFNESIKDRDTLQLEKAILQAQLQNCNSTIAANNNLHNLILAEKADSILHLANQFNQLKTDYQALYDECRAIVDNNHIVTKTKIAGILSEVNEDILTGQTALQQLSTIEPQSEQVLAAIKETEKNLNFNRGIRHSIGGFFGIQVQTD